MSLYLIIIIGAILSFGVALYSRSCKNTALHKRNYVKAQKLYKQIHEMNDIRQVYGVLRYSNPFVFEELVLYAIKKKGHKVYRSKRYTGDGGIDGKARINGEVILIQSKRYKAHINAKHVEDFVLLCEQRKKKGMFIHCGRTGKLARSHAMSDRVKIVSGNLFIDMLGLDIQ